MASPRINRLNSDYEKLRAQFDGHPFISIEPLGVVPPERYRVTYKVPSLRVDPSNRPIESALTVVEFQLPMGYPKEKPRAVALEDVFHPNFGDYVCIADFWSPAQSLGDIIIDVGEMLQWQKYNIRCGSAAYSKPVSGQKYRHSGRPRGDSTRWCYPGSNYAFWPDDFSDGSAFTSSPRPAGFDDR